MARQNEAAQNTFALYLNECLPDEMLVRREANIEIYSLVGCPCVAFGTRYKFVRVVKGQRTTVAIGRAQSKYASLNLANIRRRGARLGVQEIHLVK